VDIHQNARLTPHSREAVVQRVVVEGQKIRAVARAFAVSEKTVRKWVARFRAEGVQASAIGLRDLMAHRGAPVVRLRRRLSDYAACAGPAIALLLQHGCRRLRFPASCGGWG